MKRMLVKLFVAVLAVPFIWTACGEDAADEQEPVITGIVSDVTTLSVVKNAKVYLYVKRLVAPKITAPGDTIWDLIDSTLTNDDGKYKFRVQMDRTYQVETIANGYKMNKAVDISLNNVFAIVDFIIAPDYIDVPVGSVSGRVIKENGDPVAEAVVSISGGLFTNGYFAATQTNANGFYGIGAIPILSTTGDSIPFFTLKVSKSGYQKAVKDSIKIYENQTTGNVNITLTVQGAVNAIFSDNFETAGDWVATGFWHRQRDDNIKNVAVSKYVKLGVNDNTGGRIPEAYQGSYYYWYGVKDTVGMQGLADMTSRGNFMGMQQEYDDSLSGGTSMYLNHGTLTSPPISLAGYMEASLHFYTWWEIEGVNPNASGFDIMSVAVDTSGTDNFMELLKLNPYADPASDEDRSPLCYSSSGFNKMPLWVDQDVDLTPFAGKTIRIQFSFDTRDHLYNGFRGWFIDDLKILPIKGTPGYGSGQNVKKSMMRKRSR